MRFVQMPLVFGWSVQAQADTMSYDVMETAGPDEETEAGTAKKVWKKTKFCCDCYLTWLCSCWRRVFSTAGTTSNQRDQRKQD